MPVNPKTQKTINYYNQSADDWFATYGGDYDEKSFYHKYLNNFHQLLPSGKILEIGSGIGTDAKSLINFGYDYTGIDASSELLKIAQDRNPNGKFLCQSIQELDFPPNTFDGFWTAAILLHVSKNEIDIALQKIKSVCKKSAVGFISLKEGVGENEDSKSGRWFAYYQADEFTIILQKNGFEVIKTDRLKDPRPNKPDWLIFFVRT